MLWAHYADKHRGICLGFEIPDNPDVVHSVIYADERERQDAYFFLKTIGSQSIETAQDAMMRKLSLKYRRWEYEDEVRLLKRLEKGYDILPLR